MLETQKNVDQVKAFAPWLENPEKYELMGGKHLITNGITSKRDLKQLKAHGFKWDGSSSWYSETYNYQKWCDEMNEVFCDE